MLIQWKDGFLKLFLCFSGFQKYNIKNHIEIISSPDVSTNVSLSISTVYGGIPLDFTAVSIDISNIMGFLIKITSF